jgi:hypothetical protein
MSFSICPNYFTLLTKLLHIIFEAINGYNKHSHLSSLLRKTLNWRETTKNEEPSEGVPTSRLIFRRVRKVAQSDYYVRRVCLAVGPQVKTRLILDGFLWNLILELFSKICRKKFKFHYNRTRITGTLHED